MTREEIMAGLKDILTVLRPNTDLSTVGFDTQLVRDLGIDSLTMMLLSLAAEERFKMRFPDGQAPFLTVGEVCEFIEKAI